MQEKQKFLLVSIIPQALSNAAALQDLKELKELVESFHATHEITDEKRFFLIQ